MGEGEHIPVIGQVLQPLLDRINHAHFVIEPGQLFGSCALQGMQIMQQQVMDRRDNKGCALLPGWAILGLFVCVQEAPRSSVQTNVLDFCSPVSHKT